MTRAPLWTPEDEEALRRMVSEGRPYAEIAAALGRSTYACRDRASKKGWKKDRAAVLENRRAGREQFKADPKKVARRRKRLLASYTPLDRRIRAEEARIRNRAGTFGIKGRGHTEEARKKISDALKGRKFTAEHRQKIADGRRRFFATLASRASPVAAYREAMNTGERRVLDVMAVVEASQIWCSQCERRVLKTEARACQSRFCKVQVAA